MVEFISCMSLSAGIPADPIATNTSHVLGCFPKGRCLLTFLDVQQKRNYLVDDVHVVEPLCWEAGKARVVV